MRHMTFSGPPLRVTASRSDAEELRIGEVYTDTAERAAFRLVALEDRPDGWVELWFEQVPHCPVGRHHDTLGLGA